MPKIIVNPDTADAWEVPLGEGLNTLGSDEQSSIRIDHPSISGHHADIEVTGNITRFRDTGSGQGSFVGEEPVSDIALKPGQRLRLGDVLVSYESAHDDPGATTLASSNPDAGVHSSAKMCRFHPKVTAGYFCTQCQRAYCSLCVAPRGGASYCRGCGQACAQLDMASLADTPEEVSFQAQIPGMFSYPFRGNGLWMMLTGSVVFALVEFASHFSIVAWVILMGYGALYCRGIIHSSALGESDGPAWPDLQGNMRAEVYGACLQVIGATLVSFLPSILLSLGSDRNDTLAAAVLPAYVLGFLYLPMALLAVLMFDSVAAVNPMVVIPAILRIPGIYAGVTLLLLLLAGLKAGIYLLLETALPIPILPGLLASLVGFYFLTVSARMLGVLYHSQRHRIGWFS